MMNYTDERENTNEEASLPPFDKEEWVAQKKAEKEKAFDMISQMSEIVSHDGERFQNCLKLMSRFGKYSVGNILLLEAQKPDAKRLADFKSWKEEHVSINKGETGMLILEPGREFINKDGKKVVPINAKKVFDISQTSLPFAVEPYVKVDEKLLFRALIHNAPCRFRFADPEDMPRGEIARFSEADNAVYVVRGEDPENTFRWIAKELAAAHLRKANYDKGTADFVAVCVSYVLCERNRVDTAPYDFSKLPEGFAEMNEIQVKGTLGKIREVSNTITGDMQKFIEQQKDARSKDDAR